MVGGECSDNALFNNYSSMTRAEFAQQVDFWISQIDEFFETNDFSLIDFTHMLAMARKLMEAAHMSDKMDIDHRERLIKLAESFFKVACLCPQPATTRVSYEKGWEKWKEYLKSNGYLSGNVHLILAPHKIFADD